MLNLDRCLLPLSTGNPDSDHPLPSEAREYRGDLLRHGLCCWRQARMATALLYHDILMADGIGHRFVLPSFDNAWKGGVPVHAC